MVSAPMACAGRVMASGFWSAPVEVSAWTKATRSGRSPVQEFRGLGFTCGLAVGLVEAHHFSAVAFAHFPRCVGEEAADEYRGVSGRVR